MIMVTLNIFTPFLPFLFFTLNSVCSENAPLKPGTISEGIFWVNEYFLTMVLMYYLYDIRVIIPFYFFLFFFSLSFD